jgi:hypothetical protein
MGRSAALAVALAASLALGAVIAIQPAGNAVASAAQAPRGAVDPDDAAGIATRVEADAGEQVRFVQATPEGLYRHVSIAWASSTAPEPADDDREVELADGRRFIVRNALISLEPSGAGYRIAFDFFIPAENVPPAAVASRRDRDDSFLAAALERIDEALTATLIAAPGDSFSGSFTDVRTHVRSQSVPRRDVRYEARRAMEESGRTAGGYCTAFEVRQASDWVRRMREVNQRLSELGEGRVSQSQLDSNPAYREAQAAHRSLMAEDQAARGRIARDAAARRGGRAGAEGAGAAFQNMMIDAQTRAFMERLAALRRCHQNPTNPLAQKAKNDDPAYQKVEEALDAVEMEISGLSGMREAAVSINAAAGSQLGTVGAAMTGVIADVEDAMLKQMIEDSLASIEKCIVRCDPCSNQPASSPGSTQTFTPGPGSGSEPNYTPGPDQLFTPGPARPSQPQPDSAAAAVCKPPTRADVVYRTYRAVSGCSPVGCGTHVIETTWAGGVDLRYVPDDEGWEGRGTITYGYYEDLQMNKGVPYCPAGETSTIQASGRPSLVIRVQPTIAQTVTGGNDTSGMPENTSVVEVVAGSEPTDRLSKETKAQSCGQDKSRADELTGPGTECHFYIADLMKPGIYIMDVNDGRCTLSIY